MATWIASKAPSATLVEASALLRVMIRFLLSCRASLGAFPSMPWASRSLERDVTQRSAAVLRVEVVVAVAGDDVADRLVVVYPGGVSLPHAAVGTVIEAQGVADLLAEHAPRGIGHGPRVQVHPRVEGVQSHVRVG